MNKYIKYFESLIPPVHSTFTNISSRNDCFYIVSTEPSSVTQQIHYYFISSNILIKADTGNKNNSSFLNHIEIFRRENKKWHTIKEFRPSTPLKYSDQILKSKSKEMLFDFFKEKNSDSLFEDSYIEKHVISLMSLVFQNPIDNLASIYLNEV